MNRTSATHPLEIAQISAGPGMGCVGITFCPGKHEPAAASGGWDRDLGVDLDAIRDWGAAAVLTLVEPHELGLLRVEGLGEEVRRRGMEWFHMPIRDFSVPDAAFEQAWSRAAPALHTLLQRRRNLVVHCRGGLGRAGIVGARLLVEMGLAPTTAIAQIRAARPGAIETPEQERYVRRLAPPG